MAISLPAKIFVTAVSICPHCDKTVKLEPHQPGYKLALNVSKEDARIARIPCGCQVMQNQLIKRARVGKKMPKVKRLVSWM